MFGGAVPLRPGACGQGRCAIGTNTVTPQGHYLRRHADVDTTTGASVGRRIAVPIAASFDGGSLVSLDETPRAVRTSADTVVVVDSDPLLVPGDLDDAGLFALALALGEDGEERYWQLVTELHRRGTAAVFELASSALNSGDPVGRAVAADVLGQLGFEEGYPYRDRSVPILVERVLDDEVSVIGCAIAALGHLGDAMGLPAVVGAASHAEGVVRFEVAVALPSLLGVGPVDPSTPGVAALISLMCDDDPDVRDWATFGLGTQVATDSAEVRDALADRLADADEDVRREALVGLARRRDRRAVNTAMHVLADDDADGYALSGAIEAAALARSAALLPALRRRDGQPAVDAAVLSSALRRCDPHERQAECDVLTELVRHIERVAPRARVVISSEVLPVGDGGVQIACNAGRRELAYQLDGLLGRAGSVAAAIDILVADGALQADLEEPGG